MFAVISTLSVPAFHPQLGPEMWAEATWRHMGATPETPPDKARADPGSLWGGACLGFPSAASGPERCRLESSQ